MKTVKSNGRNRGVLDRKINLQSFFDTLADERDRWIERNRYFYEQDWLYMKFLVPPGLRVIKLGCGTGRLLNVLRPARGVGIDISEAMVGRAQKNFPHLEFHCGDVEDPEMFNSIGGIFDVVILSDTIGLLDDCQKVLENIHALCNRDTRLIISYYSKLWEPVLSLAEKVGFKMPQLEQNWLSTDDIAGLLELTDFQVIKREWRTLIPRKCWGLGTFVNRYLACLPGIRRLCLRSYVVARSMRGVALHEPSATILIPCRNERGNIEAAVQRIPGFSPKQEIIFVEGGSTDGSLDEIYRVQQAYPNLDIKVIKQKGIGKGDAVRTGFAAATGDVLMILDGDLTVPPEVLSRFYEALVQGKGEFINGTRLVYPMEAGAMQFLNEVANRLFSLLFSWLLNQRFTDTLCGTKALSRKHYLEIAANRNYFGDFDPFGDFDLIFGAARLNLKVLEIPVRYASRTYGSTQISRFRHGLMLFRMLLFAFRRMKAI